MPHCRPCVALTATALLASGGAAAAAFPPPSHPTGSNGLTLKVYDNTALYGKPTSTSVVDTAAFALPGPTHGGSWSAELVGSVMFPEGFGSGGLFNFSCDFSNTTLGFVWIDGHLVCQDGNAYFNDPTTTDNPLPVNLFNDSLLGPRSQLPFRAHVYFNSEAAANAVVDPASLAHGSVFDDTDHKCGFRQEGSSASNDWITAAQTCAKAGFTVAGAQASTGDEIWCGNSQAPACPVLPDHSQVQPCPGNHSQTCGEAWALEVINFKTHPAPTIPVTVGVTVAWSMLPSFSTAAVVSASSSGGVAEPIPTDRLKPALPAAEAQRDALQRSLAVGWGPWLHDNMLSIVKLPDAAAVTTELCQISTNKCAAVARPDGVHQDGSMPDVRVGLHAFDRSYVQFYFGAGGSGVAANVSVEYSVSTNDSDSELAVLVTPVTCGGHSAADDGACDDFEVRATSGYLWFKAGKISQHNNASLDFASAGLPPFSVHGSAGATVSAASGSDPAALHLPLGKGPVALSTSAASPDPAAVATALAAASAAETKLLRDTFGPERMDEGQAVKAAAMWTLIFTPIENAGVLHPVSRSWDFAHGKTSPAFSYAIFDWDNLFASMIAATGTTATPAAPANGGRAGPRAPLSSLLPRSPSQVIGFGFAISNLFQVIKSKVAAGFVPNFAAGGLKSQDRTEPPIGAKVTLDLVQKFGPEAMGWVVEAVFDDLVDWSDWFVRKRLLPPLGLVALGTYNDQSQQSGNMQDARFESGLDNSPMYDGEFYNSTNGCSLTESGCGLMQLYDVGMSSMFVQECFALANLSSLIGRPETLTAALRSRGETMAALIRDNLWDEQSQNFANKFSHNGSFYPRITPTSFYALQTHAASDEQADAMATRWLMNASHFCIAPDGSYTGNADTCYWGLPSIQASDPAFPPLGYWRGYIWGPMAQLTFWSLQQYDHVPSVRQARKAMCKQLAGLMMSQFNQHRHICENYNPHKCMRMCLLSETADTSDGDCSGTKFYHWGALTGMIGLQEDGLW